MLYGGFDLYALIFRFIALIIGITVHEFSHVLMAYNLGDRTGKYLGRLTLNPLAHLDPIGTLMILFGPFGWGKPAPYNPYNIRNGRQGEAMIAFAGPLSNVLVAAVAAIPLRIGFETGFAFEYASIYDAFLWIVVVNLMLSVFNLIPIPPLDGSRILRWFLPYRQAAVLDQMEQYGMILLLIVIISGVLTPVLRIVYLVAGLLTGIPGFY